MKKLLRDHPFLFFVVTAPLFLLVIVALAFLLPPGGAPGDCHVVQDETQTIGLSPSMQTQQLVYETDIVVVSISYDQFLEYIEARLHERSNENPAFHDRFQKHYDQWLDAVQTALRDGNSAPLTMGDREEPYLIAQMLEQGKAAVSDKRNRSRVATISMRIHGASCGPTGSGGRIFFFHDGSLPDNRGTKFFEVEDWSLMA